MASEQARSFTIQASSALQAGDFGLALEYLDRAIALDALDSESHLLRGIALAQVERSAEAKEAFHRALELDPRNAKAHFNLAVHLYRQGDRLEAFREVELAVQLDPGHVSARELAERIRAESSAPPLQEHPAYNMPPPAQVHTIPFIAQMGPLWTSIGWALTAAAGIVFSFGIFVGVSAAGSMEPTTDLQKAIEQSLKMQPPWLPIFDGLVRMAALGYVALDIADRRGHWAWLGIQALVGCCCPCTLLAVPLYLLVGRRKF